MTWVALALLAVAACFALAWQRSRGTARRRELTLRAATEDNTRLADLVERLVAGLSGASEGLVVVDERGAIVAANEAARRLASLPGDLRNRLLQDVVPWPRLEAALGECRREHRVVEFELDDTANEGLVLAVRVHSLPGGGLVVAIDDQSRIRRLESLRRDFVANVSHELKTPLAAIQGFVETMLDDAEMPAETRARFLGRIARQTERLSTLVADLLTLSRLDEDNAVDQAREPCDVAAVVRDTIRDLVQLADQRGLHLESTLPEDAALVRADREALRQVAGNLIDNAIKYTPGGGTVSVRVDRTPDLVRLEVADTGIGLSLEDQARVFERFYRVDRARSRDLGGTGLGLSIVKHTVRNLGGDVGVQSTLGQGSKFWVTLPRSRTEDTP
ncbi:MAG: PAS domain-containing sensor histidine kinase [Planctomycetes bacterium]|nr:PAS domain-containing sensor histidine kinase [Planctomycetota bacterium]